MSTPGTADWLREKAAEVSDQAFAEGLIRAANRIERLQTELGKQKTGVDQSYTPVPAPRRLMPAFQRGGTVISTPVYRIRLTKGELASDTEARERVFDWIDGSERLGMGLLDPCNVFVLGEPDVKGGIWDLDPCCQVSTLQKEKHNVGFVRISGVSRKGPLGLLEKHLNDIDLTECYVLDVENTRDETIIELAAKEAKDVRQEDTDDSVSA